MNGSKQTIESPVSIPDRKLVAELLTYPVEISGQIQIRAGLSSRARVLFRYQPPTSRETTFECDVYLDAGACLDIFHIVQSTDAHLSVKFRYHLKKHASLNVWTYVGSAAFVNLEQEAIFEEEHAFASLRGLSVLDGAQQTVHKVKATHKVGHGISRQFYKSVVTDSAKSTFESLVYVERGAAKSDSKQLNKNLVLSAGAVAVSRPELKIYADDVACAHGSATGQIDANELFYLRSRGIAEHDARALMIEGFAEEPLEDVSDADLKKELQLLAQVRIGELIR